MSLKTREKYFISAAVLIAVVMGFDQFVTTPKKKEAVSLQKQVQEANEKIGSVTASLSGLIPARKRMEEKKREVGSLAGRIPDERQLDILLDQLSREGQAKTIELLHLNIKEEPLFEAAEGQKRSPGGILKKMALEMGLSAAYGRIGDCLDSIQALPIFLELEQVDISRKGDSFPKLEITLKQNLYISPPGRRGSQEDKGGQSHRPSS
ncbi:MAG: type 4a pilus biogenesis protein PilO [Thermodesulfobacteriota bacterium]